MKEYDLSDRKLKILVVLAMVIIGWFCAKGAIASHSQTARASPRTTSATERSWALSFAGKLALLLPAHAPDFRGRAVLIKE